jgi:hypothetical protein
MVKPQIEAELKKLSEDIQNSAEAALAKSIAETIDNDKTSATAKANLAKVLVEVIDRLRALAAEGEEQEGKLDELRSRRRPAA